MAAALLAMRHFNQRNFEVVPELGTLPEGCNFQFDLNRSLFFDTGSNSHMASQSFLRELTTGSNIPCAIAGPYNDFPALELATLAQAATIPQVVHRARTDRIVSNRFSPFTTMTYPNTAATVDTIVDFLFKFIKRTNYFSYLYAFDDEGIQTEEALGLTFERLGITNWISESYLKEQRTIMSRMERIKLQGYRTVLLAPDDMLSEIPLMAEAAEALGMNNGEWLFVFLREFDPSLYSAQDPLVIKFLSGSMAFLPSEGHLARSPVDSFYRLWTEADQEFIDIVNSMNPLSEGDVGYQFAGPDFFRTFAPETGAGFLYDGVISIGIGACIAQARSNSSTVSGAAHVIGIRQSAFRGASGAVTFGGNARNPAARAGESVTWTLTNVFPPSSAGDPILPFTNPMAHFPDLGGWVPFQGEFIYKDGTTSPPLQLRTPPDQNFLSDGLRIFGYVLLGVVMLSSAFTMGWVFMLRKHRVLLAAQPSFLYMLCFGSMISSLAIITISQDESFGWSDEQLSRACMATPWLISAGTIITYGALFSKLWRVNKVLQFTRRKIDVQQVAWPTAILFVSAIVIMSLWNALDPLTWERTIIDPITEESIGQCNSDHFAAWLGPLIGIMVIPAVLTGFMAWKTRDVDDAYAESSWIFFLIVVQLEIVVVAVPIITILRDISTDGKYVGFVLLLWVFPMSTQVFVMLPKFIAYKNHVEGRSDSSTLKRGSSLSGVRITGLGASNSRISNNHAIREHGMSQISSVSRYVSESPIYNSSDEFGALEEDEAAVSSDHQPTGDSSSLVDES